MRFTRWLPGRRRSGTFAMPVLIAPMLALALALPVVAPGGGSDHQPTRSIDDAVPVSSVVPAESVEAIAAEHTADGAAIGAYVTQVQLAQYAELVHQSELDAAAAAMAARRSVRGASRGRCGADVECFLECTRNRETHGNYGAVSRGGTYRGAYQFDQNTWDSNAAASGRGDLVGADPASVPEADQDQVASDTYARRGTQPWGGMC